jgi:hypothetical protein
METNDQKQNLIHSYLALRNSIGFIGILMPFTLVIGNSLIFKADCILYSISRYYYSCMRDVFVGALCGIALFLFFYRGYDNWKKINWDKWITTTGGFLALGIAFFHGPEDGGINLSGLVHLLCASLFFALLACYSIFVFTRKSSNPTIEKLDRNKIYLVCGLVMFACIAGIIIYFSCNNFDPAKTSKTCFVFWAETIALVAFGTSWITKGGTIHPDKTIIIQYDEKKDEQSNEVEV